MGPKYSYAAKTVLHVPLNETKTVLRGHSSIRLQISECAPSHPSRFNSMVWKRIFSVVNTSSYMVFHCTMHLTFIWFSDELIYMYMNSTHFYKANVNTIQC